MPFTPKPAAEQGTLAVGERLCNLDFLDTHGRPFSLYDNQFFGWPKVICLSRSAVEAEAQLVQLAAKVRDFGEREVHIIAVTRSSVEDNAAIAAQHRLPYPVLNDPSGALQQAAGLGDAAAPRLLFFSSILSFEQEFADPDPGAQVAAAFDRAHARFTLHNPQPASGIAPVLTVPQVLDPDHCRRLIDHWQHGAKLDNMVSSQTVKAQQKETTKVRGDVMLPIGSAESNELLAVMRRRLLPEVSKAFNFDVTRFEPFRVGCYDSADGGRFAPHRDNTTPVTAHRRYALVINLNTGDYEGGYLRLPEYGPQLLMLPRGGAVVFSCSLLHLATPVMKGRRFVVVGFFWAEEDQILFEQSHADKFPDGTSINLVP